MAWPSSVVRRMDLVVARLVVEWLPMPQAFQPFEIVWADGQPIEGGKHDEFRVFIRFCARRNGVDGWNCYPAGFA